MPRFADVESICVRSRVLGGLAGHGFAVGRVPFDVARGRLRRRRSSRTFCRHALPRRGRDVGDLHPKSEIRHAIAPDRWRSRSSPTTAVPTVRKPSPKSWCPRRHMWPRKAMAAH